MYLRPNQKKKGVAGRFQAQRRRLCGVLGVLGLWVVKVVEWQRGGAHSPTSTFYGNNPSASTYGVEDDTQVVTWDKEIWSPGLNKSRARVQTMSTIKIHKVP